MHPALADSTRGFHSDVGNGVNTPRLSVRRQSRWKTPKKLTCWKALLVPDAHTASAATLIGAWSKLAKVAELPPLLSEMLTSSPSNPLFR